VSLLRNFTLRRVFEAMRVRNAIATEAADECS
jgi:hypothetical protein